MSMSNYDDSRDQPLPGMPEPPAVDALADDIGAAAAQHASEPPVDEPAAVEPAAVEAPAAPVRVPSAPWRTRGRPEIEITNEAESHETLYAAINGGVLPDVYRRGGRLVVVDELDEAPVRRMITNHGGRNLIVRDVEPATMRRLLSEHTFTFVMKKESRKVDAPLVAIRAVPAPQVCRDVLDAHTWPGVPALAGVTSSPVLRPDGSLVQTRGYDEATGMYYAPALTFDPVPATPAESEVREARELVVERVLGDFPWVDKADLANYLALLVAPVLRTLNGSLTPLGAITAATAGTGKTLLAGDIPAALFGITSRPWVDNDDEVRKSVSTILLTSNKPVALFDNVPETRTVDSPMLAKLLTSSQWDDRLLGGNEGVDEINDRLWLVTGNSMTFGGDMPSRTVLVRVDAKVARPDLRDPSEFKIPDLQAWLTDPDNAAELLRALLILIADWVAAGRPMGNYVMRQFTPWARAAGGFLDHHNVHGFLANRSALDAIDEETAQWLGFCHMWHTLFGEEWTSPTQVVQSAEKFRISSDGDRIDPWQGQMFTDRHTGRPLSVVALGKRLGSKIGKIFPAGDGAYRLDRHTHPRSGQNTYRVQRVTTAGQPDGPAPVPRPPTLFDHDDE